MCIYIVNIFVKKNHSQLTDPIPLLVTKKIIVSRHEDDRSSSTCNRLHLAKHAGGACIATKYSRAESHCRLLCPQRHEDDAVTCSDHFIQEPNNITEEMVVTREFIDRKKKT